MDKNDKLDKVKVEVTRTVHKQLLLIKAEKGLKTLSEAIQTLL